MNSRKIHLIDYKSPEKYEALRPNRESCFLAFFIHALKWLQPWQHKRRAGGIQTLVSRAHTQVIAECMYNNSLALLYIWSGLLPSGINEMIK